MSDENKEVEEVKNEAILPELKGDIRYEGDAVYRYEATTQDTPVRIDREKNMMYGVRGMLSRPVNKDYYYSHDAQSKVYKNYEGMPLGLNHDYKQGSPTIERTIGKISKSYMDDKGTLFDIQYNSAHERMEQILTDAETGLNTISLSCIAAGCRQEGNIVTSFTPVGCDFVAGAGQTNKLFEQAKPELELKYEQLIKDIEILKGKFNKYEQIQPATVSAAVVAMEQKLETRGINLKEFHDAFINTNS